MALGARTAMSTYSDLENIILTPVEGSQKTKWIELIIFQQLL
jgi:hypothetical protein